MAVYRQTTQAEQRTIVLHSFLEPFISFEACADADVVEVTDADIVKVTRRAPHWLSLAKDA